MPSVEKCAFFTTTLARIATIAILLVLSAKPVQAHPKTDVVVLNNGDRVTGEIKKLERGKLFVSTDSMGTVEIEWDKIERVTSQYRYTVALRSGLRVVGSLAPGEENQVLDVVSIGDKASIGYLRVVEIEPLEESFWQRLKGSVDFGFSFAEANTATQWSLNAEAKYLTRKYLATTNFSSLLQDQEDADRITRNVVTLGYRWFLGDRWYALGLSAFQQSSAQGLELRSLFGGGAGRHVYQSNKSQLSIVGALDVVREKYVGKNFTTSSEAIAGLNFETFRYETPKAEITGHVFVFPNLTTLGRVRLQAEGNVRFELIKDLFFNVNVYESFDSDPPVENVSRNDFSITTSLGWTF
jgi:putative salt-induced outer membrane protein YdiY